MENPFELILERLDRIERKLDLLENGPSQDQLMTIEEVAQYIHYQKTSIYGLVQKRKIPFIKGSGKLHFRKSEIDNWLDQRKVKTKSEIEKMADEYILRNPLP
ncbi:helix-turn-helix transcriptional regulator [Christiangramia salexigens]|uniref:Helix-turn-helix domain-containing protein n=1 Tax=Christiangramia salexigens TaxID=1913577 RepID=A0A1L3J1L6_9FLAO|nr:helix-turn-helix domain-containing protein [Christiangramia salexigens]APG59016.1 hypothetical protein LPB144_00735 [Christiangramia salexigens]